MTGSLLAWIPPTTTVAWTFFFASEASFSMVLASQVTPVMPTISGLKSTSASPIYVRHGLEVNNFYLVVIEITRQGFKRERFAPEKHFQGIDTILFFGDATAAIGRVDKENLHVMSA